MTSMEPDSLESLREVSTRLGTTNLSKLLHDYTNNATGSKLALVLQELSDKPNKEVKFSWVSFSKFLLKKIFDSF